MPYGEAKIYHDGSHFIAIPYVPNLRSRRPKPPEEQITVVDENADNETIDGLSETDEPINDTFKKSEAAVVGKDSFIVQKSFNSMIMYYLSETSMLVIP